MKKLIIILCLVVPLLGQNLQVHYELRGDRQYLTSTLEQFTGDKLGLTYWFISAAYTDLAGGNDLIDGSATSVYGEFYRFFTIPKTGGLMAGIQYNDGFMIYPETVEAWPDMEGWTPPISGQAFGHTWLAGLAYNVPIGKMHVLTTVWLRKKQGYNYDWQLTLAWGHTFANDKLTFNGFFDLWGEKPEFNNEHLGQSPQYRVVLLTEPQLYYNFNPHLAAGVKAQVSYNFEHGYDGQLRWAPTVAARWNF
jgi:hypothetical protein